jgi:hypothetical protein
MGFKALMEVIINITYVWDVMLCTFAKLRALRKPLLRPSSALRTKTAISPIRSSVDLLAHFYNDKDTCFRLPFFSFLSKINCAFKYNKSFSRAHRLLSQ